MAETAKKAKKKKGKTLALTEFLADDGENGSSSVSHAAVFSARSTSWADESEELNTEVDTAWPEEAYGGVSTDKKLRAAMDRAALPTAPRAARGPDIDTSKIPEGPPYTAFLGNLSYDVDKDDILEFFGTNKITEVRLPQDNNGRLKGFGYAEFADKEALLAALTLNNEHLKNRRIRVDIAGQQQQQDRERGDRDGRGSGEPDRTESDWRSKPEPHPNQNGYNDRERRYDDGPRGGYDSGPRDRWGHRGDDEGPYRDRSGFGGYDDRPPRDRSGFRSYDDGPSRDRSGYKGYDDGPSRGFGSGWGDRQDDYERGNDRYDGYGRDRPDSRRYGDRYGGDRDRGGGFGRDRYDDRRDRFGGDRDRFGGDRDRYGGDRDRYGGDRDRYGGDRDRYGGDRDRYGGDRDRYGGDRDRYGGDRDRGSGYGRDRYDDRRYDDRRGGDRYGDRDRRHDSYDDRDSDTWRDSDRGRDARSDFDRDEREPVRERPKLHLQPRTKPLEDKSGPVSGSSVFGGAKPVDTAAKEREIEEKLARQKLEEETKLAREKEGQKERREREDWPRSSSSRPRRDSNRSNEGERGAREHRDSSDYRSRRDSGRSSDEGTSSKDTEAPSRDSPRGGGKETKETPKEPPKDAPPPAVNVWAKRMEQQKAASATDATEAKSPTREHRVEINVDSASMSVTSPPPPTSPERKGFGKPPGPKREFSGPPRGRGRGGERSSTHAPAGRGIKKDRRERKPAEPKKYEEAPQPVFHKASKFSALLVDNEAAEEDTEQFEGEEET